MAIETIGFITLNNINKSIEYIIPLLISIAGIFAGVFFKYLIGDAKLINLFSKNINFNIDKNFDIIIKSLIIYVFSNVFLSILSIINAAYISLLILFIFLVIFKDNYESKLQNILILGAFPSLLLINKLYSTTNSLFIFALVIIIYALVLAFTSLQYFAFACILFTFKYILVGDFVVNDAFHSAEHFLASSKIFDGIFSIFPNIGYLEELPGYFLSKILSKLTNDNIQLSILTSRYLLVCALTPLLIWFVYRKDRLIALLFYFALPTDRISLLIALLYSALIIYYFYNRKNNIILFIFSGIPILFLGLSPSYILLPLLALIIIINWPFKSYIGILLILLIWIVLALFLHSEIYIYLSTYRDFNGLFDVGFSTTISSLGFKDLIIWNIYLFFLVMIVTSVTMESSKNILSKIVKILLLSILFYKFVSYGFGRIDPGFTRLLSLGIPLLYIVSLVGYRYFLSIRLLLIFVILSYINIGLPELNFKINSLLHNKKEGLILLSDANRKVVENIISFADGNNVINYSMEPALSHYIPGSKVPQFTSPYVTLGYKAQDTVINFFKLNKNSIIYIGHDFKTFDGIDVRLRVPLIYKFISENYNLIQEMGNIYAVPKYEHPGRSSSNDFFTDMNFNKSVLFFNRIADSGNTAYEEVFVECNGADPRQYRLVLNNSSLIGQLSCGRNAIPKSFLWGNILAITPI